MWTVWAEKVAQIARTFFWKDCMAVEANDTVSLSKKAIVNFGTETKVVCINQDGENGGANIDLGAERIACGTELMSLQIIWT